MKNKKMGKIVPWVGELWYIIADRKWEIRDGYPRYIISLDKFRDQQEGVHHINAIDLFLGKEKI